MTYYYIEKYGLLARCRDGSFENEIYDADRGWVKDEWAIISDYLMGYDSSEEPDSPYRFGGGSVMDIDEILADEAKEIMKDYTFILGENPRRWNP